MHKQEEIEMLCVVDAMFWVNSVHFLFIVQWNSQSMEGKYILKKNLERSVW